MLLSRYVWPLAGLVPGFGWAATANLNSWDIDDSCTNWHDSTTAYNYGKTGGVNQTSYLQESFNIALDMAIAAKDSLTYALRKRPDEKTDRDGYLKWVRIVESMAVTLSFISNDNIVDDPDTGYWADVLDLYTKTINTLQAHQNNPAKGYNEKIPLQPMFVCGDNWQWLDDAQNVPQLKPATTISRYFKNTMGKSGPSKGAWYKNHRWVAKDEARQKPVFCIPRLKGEVRFDYNLIVICDIMFLSSVKETKSPADIKRDGTIKAGDKLEDYTGHLAYTIVHELMHWFGGPKKSVEGPAYNLKAGIIRDQPAINKNGMLMYSENGVTRFSDTILSKADAAAKKWEPFKTYGPTRVWNLARLHTGGGASYSGAKVATKNADSLAMFALMMYFDDWNWAWASKARKLDDFSPIYKPIKRPSRRGISGWEGIDDE